MRCWMVVGALALSGCASVYDAVYGGDIARDRAFVEDGRARLKCGMSVYEVEQAIGGPLIASDAPSQRWVRRYHHGLVDLFINFDENRLRSTQLVVATGLESGTAEAEKSLCH